MEKAWRRAAQSLRRDRARPSRRFGDVAVGLVAEIGLVGFLCGGVPLGGEDTFAAEILERVAKPPMQAKRSMKVNLPFSGSG